MPVSTLHLPPGAFLFCTTNKADKYWIGQVMRNPRDRSTQLEVVLIVERKENGLMVYDVYVKII